MNSVLEVNQKQLLYLKKNYLNVKQKTYCKKFEQTGGEIIFLVEDIKYKLIYKQSKAYTDFVFNQDYMKHRGGIMNRGAGPLVQDKYGKINYTEENIIRQLDKNKNKK